MVDTFPAPTYSIRRFFAGKNVFVTGSTGFLAKALVVKILRDLPETKKIFLLIRPRAQPNGSLVEPRQRLRDEILRNTAFDALRRQWGERFEALCLERLECVPGDLTRPHLGLEADAFAALAQQVQVVINSAATVSFDERLDVALDINTLSPQRLLELAAAAGATYVHVSTAYVSGMRQGLVPERVLEPMEALDAQMPPGVPRPERFEVEHEIARLQELCRGTIGECEERFRQRGWAGESEEARAELRRALVTAGRLRSRSLGWNDIYTYSKFLGEQLVVRKHGPVPTAIVRPSIIESSLREPEPGWLDGLRMADPIIIGFGKGRLTDFPAGRDVVLDIIPADLVVNGILAAAASLGSRPGALDLIQVASSSENPLLFRALYDMVRDYFQKNPLMDREGRPVSTPHWKFPGIENYKRRLKNFKLRPVQVARAIYDSPLPLPGRRRMRAFLRQKNKELEMLLNYVDLYSPYTSLNCRFETRHAREVLERMEADERACFDFDPRHIHWRHYIQEVHIPGLKRNILRMEAPAREGAGEAAPAAAPSASLPPEILGLPRTIVELAARGAERFGDRLFLEIRRAHEGERSVRTHLTFRELFARSGGLARLLRARLDLRPGERVALWSENGPEWALAYLAISRAGGVVVPLDRQLPPEDAAGLVRFVEAKAVILSPAQLHKAGTLFAAGQGLPPRLNLLDGLAPWPGDEWPCPHAALDSRPLPEPAPHDWASILFTSGTTYAPKGVILTHQNFVANALAVAEVLEPLATDHFLSVLPLHHALEFTGGLLVPLFGGAAVHYVETLRAREIQETMRGAGITVVLGVPRLFQLFADKIRARIEEAGLTKRMAVGLMDWVAGAAEWMGHETLRKSAFAEVHAAFGGKLRLFVSGGAALPPELFHFFARFGIPVAEGYGLTESAPILTVNPLHKPKPGSVGLPIPGTELKLRQPDANGIGEVLARGPSLLQGYWHDPEASEKAFEDGWLRTGDLGRLDADGYLFLTGRLKDVIVTGAGKNVYPEELEMRLRGLPGVKELCVVGLPARHGHGEEVTLVAVPEGAPAVEAVRAALEKTTHQWPSFQQITRLEFQADELPKTSTLKVQRGKVRERYMEAAQWAASLKEAGAAGGTPAAKPAAPPGAADALLATVAAAVAEAAGVAVAEILPEKRLQLDLGLDSFGRVDLAGRLEQAFDVTLADDLVARLTTVGDVLAAVAEALGPRAAGGPAAAPAPSLPERVWQREETWDATAALRPSFPKQVLQGAMHTTERVFFNTWLRIEASGLDHLPARGAYILASNHCSHLDTAAVRAVLGPRAGRLHVMGAKDYFFDTRFRSWFFSTMFNVLPFDREEHTLEGLALCRKVLEGGQALLIFPEGTRSITGQLLPFKAGIGILALELDFPILPVRISGTFAALPKGRALPRPSHVRVRFGAPLDFRVFRERHRLESARPPGGTPAEEPVTGLGPSPAAGESGRKRARGLADSYREAAEFLRAAVEALSRGE